jgi:hypothetical protein
MSTAQARAMSIRPARRGWTSLTDSVTCRVRGQCCILQPPMRWGWLLLLVAAAACNSTWERRESSLAEHEAGGGPRRGAGSSGVRLRDGSRRPAELLIFAIGVTPDLRLVKDTGIAAEQGILTDDTMQTSVNGIYAAGDVVQTTDLLGGGARDTHHFTEMVGGALHVTINWSTAEEIIKADPPLTSRIDALTPQAVIDELCDKLPDFRKAYYDDGLSIEEFGHFAPLRYFRNMFLKGWDTLLESVREQRSKVSAVSRRSGIENKSMGVL